jgi:hypothetical protein
MDARATTGAAALQTGMRTGMQTGIPCVACHRLPVRAHVAVQH